VHFCLLPYAYLPCYYPLRIIYFLHLLSTNHKCTQPCYFPLVLKPAAQKEKMHWNSLMRSSRLCVALLFFSLRVVIVLRDTIYVVIILYSWHLVICDYFWPYVWNNWSRVMHTMSTWFWQKNHVWQLRDPQVPPDAKTDVRRNLP
jgi:hypothetical protein